MAVAAVGLVLLAGCSRPVERPAPLPTPTAPAASGTPSPSPLLPTPSPTVTEYSPAGATAFVEYYFAVLNYAYITGDTSTLESLSAPSCKTCAEFSDGIRRNWEAGSLQGGQVTLSNSAVPQLLPENTVVSSNYAQTESRTVADDGSILKSTAPNSGRVYVSLRHQGSAWIVTKMQVGD